MSVHLAVELVEQEVEDAKANVLLSMKWYRCKQLRPVPKIQVLDAVEPINIIPLREPEGFDYIEVSRKINLLLQKKVKFPACLRY